MPSANSQSNEPIRVLPLWAVLRKACLFPWQHRRHVGRLLLVPVTLSIFLTLLNLYWENTEDSSVPGIALNSAFSLLHSAVFTFFAVSYHRSILIGEHAVSWFGVRGWTMRETRFFLWFITMYLVAVLFVGLVSAAVSMLAFSLGGMMGDAEAVVEHPAFLAFGTLIILVPFVYVVGRMSLILPAVAVDLRPTLSWAMLLSEGNGWRVALLVGGTPFVALGLYTLILWILGLLPDMTGEQTIHKLDIRSAAIGGWNALVYYGWYTIEVAILSFTFRELAQTELRQLRHD